LPIRASGLSNMKLIFDRKRLANKFIARVTTRSLPSVSRPAAAVQDIQTTGREFGFAQQMQAARPGLWPPDAPHLYRVRSQVLDQERIVEEDPVVGAKDTLTPGKTMAELLTPGSAR
jgi:hypothetical protein